MKFYVNIVYDRSLKDSKFGINIGSDVIGLFSQCKTDGRGNFCGYYASEYYLNTKLYAYYEADCKGLYAPEKRISDVVALNRPIECDEVMIGSHMWTRVIEADSIDEAIMLFKNAEWHSWSYSEDEFESRR